MSGLLQNINKENQFNKVSMRRGKPGSKQASFAGLAKVNWLELYQTEQCEVKLNISQIVRLSGLDCFFTKTNSYTVR